MRASISGSPVASSLRRLSSLTAVTIRRRSSREMPAGSARLITGSPCERNCTPWCRPGRKPLCQYFDSKRLPARAGPESSTTNAGMFAFSVPSPYDSHDPRHGRPVMLLPDLQEHHRRIVIDRLGVHRADDGDLVDDGRHVRQQFADLQPAVAAARETELRTGERKSAWLRGHRREALAADDALGDLLPVHLPQLRLVIEQIHLRRPARHEQIDHVLGSPERSPLRGASAVFRESCPGIVKPGRRCQAHATIAGRIGWCGGAGRRKQLGEPWLSRCIGSLCEL